MAKFIELTENGVPIIFNVDHIQYVTVVGENKASICTCRNIDPMFDVDQTYETVKELIGFKEKINDSLLDPTIQ